MDIIPFLGFSSPYFVVTLESTLIIGSEIMPPSMCNPGRRVEPISQEAEVPPLDYSHFEGLFEVGPSLQGSEVTPNCATDEATNAPVTEFLRSRIDFSKF